MTARFDQPAQPLQPKEETKKKKRKVKRAASNLTTRSLSDEKKKVKESSKQINETILKKNQEYLSIKQFINRYIDKIKQKLELRQNKHKQETEVKN